MGTVAEHGITSSAEIDGFIRAEFAAAMERLGVPDAPPPTDDELRRVLGKALARARGELGSTQAAYVSSR
jgi:hypothetical protein